MPEAAVAQIAALQAQISAMIQLLETRVEGNKQQSDGRLDALKLYTDATVTGLRERNDERWNGFRSMLSERQDRLELTAHRYTDELRELINTKLSLLVELRDANSRDIEKRLDGLNYENDRLQALQDTYVRADLYAKDMERLYQEKRDAQAQAAAAKVAQDNTEATGRRNTALTILSSAISVVAVVVTIVLHFADKTGH